MAMKRASAPSLATLVAATEAAAKKYASGHLTVLRFSGHWKVFLGTVAPELYSSDYERVSEAPPYPSLEAALLGLLATLPYPAESLFPEFNLDEERQRLRREEQQES